MFAKFDENGKIVSYSDAENLEDIHPNPEDFEKISNFSESDILYLVKKNDVVKIDTESKNKDAEKKEKAKIYEENKQMLVKLTEDIVQYVAGEDVPNIEERKAEFIRIHNEVRIYEGKEIRNIKS